MGIMIGAILLWTCRERASVIQHRERFIKHISLQARGMHQHTEVVAVRACVGHMGCIISGSRVSTGRSLGGMIGPRCMLV